MIESDSEDETTGDSGSSSNATAYRQRNKGKGKSLKLAKANVERQSYVPSASSKKKSSIQAKSSSSNAADDRVSKKSSLESASGKKLSSAKETARNAAMSNRYSQEIEPETAQDSEMHHLNDNHQPRTVQEPLAMCEEVWIMDSDEETVTSTPKIKTEPVEEEELIDGASATRVSDTDPLDASSDSAMFCQVSSDDETYFPVLSQPFLDEIEAEEVANNDTASKARSSAVPELQKRQPDSRLPVQATGSKSGSNGESAVKKSKPAERPTMVKFIPMLPLKSSKSHKKDTSTRSKIQEKQDLTSYTVSVKQATGKKSGNVQPSTSFTPVAPQKALVPRSAEVHVPDKSARKSATPKVIFFYMNKSILLRQC